jgi:hypothetical protein
VPHQPSHLRVGETQGEGVRRQAVPEVVQADRLRALTVEAGVSGCDLERPKRVPPTR